MFKSSTTCRFSKIPELKTKQNKKKKKKKKKNLEAIVYTMYSTHIYIALSCDPKNLKVEQLFVVMFLIQMQFKASQLLIKLTRRLLTQITCSDISLL